MNQLHKPLIKPWSGKRPPKRSEAEQFGKRVTALAKKVRRQSQGPKSLRQKGSKRGVVPIPTVKAQRVVMKARIVKASKNPKQQLQKHVQYLQREGGEIEYKVYNEHELSVNTTEFVKESSKDRHSFRFIVSPENAKDLDLTRYTRDVMHAVEKDLNTKLAWVAVNHYDTDNPHTHILLRGKDEHGKDLIIDPSYMSQGFRHRAQEIATQELGERTSREIKLALRKDITANRVTGFDHRIHEIMKDHHIPLRKLQHHSELASRLRHLEQLGLSRLESETKSWKIERHYLDELNKLSRHGDMIRTLHERLAHTREQETSKKIKQTLDIGL